MNLFKILKTTALLLLISFCGCKEKKQPVAIPKAKTNMLIVRGNYNSTDYKYPDAELLEWQATGAEVIFLEKKQPNFTIKTDSIKNGEIQNSKAIHKGFINRKEGASIFTKKNFSSEIILTLPQGALIHIVETDTEFKQYKDQDDNALNGKWVKVEYKKLDNTVLTGYVLDDFINYSIDTTPLVNVNDTIIVRNEAEFLKALSSNRLIEIKTDKLDFESYFKSIDEHIPTEEELEYIEHETYYTTSYYEDDELLALGLYGYNNLIIRGRNNTVEFVVDDEASDVFTLKNCQKIVIENINFYHNVSTSCEGEVVVIDKCNNLLFNNIYFNGSGNIGAVIEESNTIDFRNSHFFNNSLHGVSLFSSKNISLTNSTFYNNSFASAINTDTKEPEDDQENEKGHYKNTINLKDVIIFNNTIHTSVFDLENVQFDCLDCSIQNNLTSSLVESEYNANFNFINSRFTDNFGKKGDYIILNNGTKISIKNSTIKDNNNYYDFIDNGANYTADKLTIVENTLNQKIDSIPNPKNSTIINGKAYMNRKSDELFRNKNNQYSTLSYTLKDLQAIEFSQYNTSSEFLNLDLSFIKDASNIFNYAYGSCKDGKLEGLWRFTDNNRECFILDVNYVNGTANGEVKVYGFGNTLLIEGHYIDNKKTGTWNFYNQKGIITKTLNYKYDKEIGPFIIYYPNGITREVRSNKELDKGTVVSYYPNEEKLSYMVFNDDTTIDFQKTKFFNTEGDELDIIKSKAILIKNRQDIESNLPKKRLKNKVVILEDNNDNNSINKYFGYYQTNKKGEKHGFFKLLDLDVNKDDKTFLVRGNGYDMIFSQYNRNTLMKSELYKDGVNRLRDFTTDEKKLTTVCNYDGWFNALSEVVSVCIDSTGSFTKAGLYQKYYANGTLKEEGVYKDDKKVEGTWKTHTNNY